MSYGSKMLEDCNNKKTLYPRNKKFIHTQMQLNGIEKIFFTADFGGV
jgi:hypothetical protein